MNLNISKLSPKLQTLVELVADYLNLSLSDEGVALEVFTKGQAIEIRKEANSANITIGKEQYFLRALGLLVENINTGHEDFKIKESPAYDRLALIFECSSKDVLNCKTYKTFVIKAALMGFETIVGPIAKDDFSACWEYDSQRKKSYDSMAIELAHASYVENNIKTMIITVSGDKEIMTSRFSALPTLQLWAELCYANNSADSYLASRFKTCIKGDYQDFLKLDMPILPANNSARANQELEPWKYILYQDILTDLPDQDIDKAAYTLHFQKCSRELGEIIKNKPSKWTYVFETQKALSDVLAIKTHASINIRAAYKEGNKDRLESYANIFLPELRRALEALITIYRAQWMKENKALAFKDFDLCIGGLLQRIKTAQLRIIQYLSGEIDAIEELEEVEV